MASYRALIAFWFITKIYNLNNPNIAGIMDEALCTIHCRYYVDNDA